MIGTLRRECLDHLIIINERHLRAVLREYEAYYNNGRPHRSLDLETPTGSAASCRSAALLGRCWVAYITSTSGWLRDPPRYG